MKEFFDKNLKTDLKQNKINEIGLKSVIQLLADKDLRGAEILLNHMVSLYLELSNFCKMLKMSIILYDLYYLFFT